MLSPSRLPDQAERRDAPPFQVADNGPVAMTALPGKVINADYARVILGLDRTSPDEAQQGVIAHRQQQTSREALSRSSPSARPR